MTHPDAKAHPIDAEALFREHARFVASFLRHLGSGESELDDLVQDVFVLAHRKGGYQPGAASPRTWLASLAARLLLARRRAAARRPVSSRDPDDLTDEGADFADHIESRRALRRVQETLDQLSVEHRATFILYEIEGEACEDIAATWQVPIGTVYSRLHHARKRFIEVYGRQAHARSKSWSKES